MRNFLILFFALCFSAGAQQFTNLPAFSGLPDDTNGILVVSNNHYYSTTVGTIRSNLISSARLAGSNYMTAALVASQVAASNYLNAVQVGLQVLSSNYLTTAALTVYLTNNFSTNVSFQSNLTVNAATAGAKTSIRQNDGTAGFPAIYFGTASSSSGFALGTDGSYETVINSSNTINFWISGNNLLGATLTASAFTLSTAKYVGNGGGLTNVNAANLTNIIYYTNTLDASTKVLSNSTPFAPGDVRAMFMCVTNDAGTGYKVGDRIELSQVSDNDVLLGNGPAIQIWSCPVAVGISAGLAFVGNESNWDIITRSSSSVAGHPTTWLNFKLLFRVTP